MPVQFTLLIPTKNRSDFLHRLLRSLAGQNFEFDILIGDSSDDDHWQKAAQEIDELKGKLNIKHERCLGKNTVQTIEHLCRWITTPYAGLICDDDFVCVDGIHQCIEFLNHHPDFGGARGTALLISLDRTGPFGNIIHISPYGPYSPISLEEESGAERLREFSLRMPSIHSSVVYRVGIWKEMHAGYPSMQGSRPGFIFEELFASVIAAICSKIKALDCLLLVRQTHEEVFRKTSFGDWVTDPEWLPAFQFLQKTVVQKLVQQDQLDPAEAEKIFYEVFHRYLRQFWEATQFKQAAKKQWSFRAKGLLRYVAQKIFWIGKANRRRKVHRLRRRLASPNHFLYPHLNILRPIFDSLREIH